MNQTRIGDNVSPVEALLQSVRRAVPPQTTDADDEFDRGRAVGWNEALTEVAIGAGVEPAKLHD